MTGDNAMSEITNVQSEAPTMIPGDKTGAGTPSNDYKSGARGKGDRRASKGRYFVDISNKDFEGDTPEIGCVVGLKSEKITAKVQFDTFRDKVTEFILKELTNGIDVVPYVKDMEDPSEDFVRRFLPTNLTTSERQDHVKKGVFEQKLKKYVDREYLMYDNRIKLYTYIWGQCSSGVKSVVMGENDFKEKHGRKDVIWLLVKIKLITAGLDSKTNKYDNIYEVMMTFLTMRQGETESNSDYLKRFKSNAETVKLMCGLDFFVSREVIGKAFFSDDDKKESTEKLKAMIMLKRADNKRFGDLKKRLREASDVGRDEYPTTVAGAYDLLVRTQDQIRVSYEKSNNRFKSGDRSKLMFVQTEDSAPDDVVLVAGIDGTINPKMTCWHCNKVGHGRDNCPTNPSAGSNKGAKGTSHTRRGISNLMRGMIFAQRKSQKSKERFADIPSSWILLDTCSTVDVMVLSNSGSPTHPHTDGRWDTMRHHKDRKNHFDMEKNATHHKIESNHLVQDSSRHQARFWNTHPPRPQD